MASSATLLYQSQQEVDNHTFYRLRLDLVPEIYEDLIDFLVLVIGEDLPDELSVLDLPFLIPSSIASGTAIHNYSGIGSYTLTETIYFAYAKGFPHIHAVYDVDEPGSSDIAIAQAFFGETEIWYSDIAPGSLEEWPSGDDPVTNPPDTTGWSYPDLLEQWGWTTDGAAQRFLSPFFYTDVWLENLIAWAGCTDWEEDEDHFLSVIPDTYLGNRWRWSTDPNLIYSCNEEDSSFLYWIERTGSNPENLFVWKYKGDPAYYYPHLDYSDALPGVVPYDIIVRPAMDLLNLLDINVPAMQGGIYQLMQLANLYADNRHPLGINIQGVKDPLGMIV